MTHRHLMATDHYDKRCRKCGVWKLEVFKCNIPGCNEKQTNVKMCNCTYKGLRKK